MKKLSRREIVAGSAAVALGSAAPASEASAQAKQPAKKSNQPKENRPRKVSPWITLEPAFTEKVFDNTRVRLRAYNGQVPGPPIKTIAGELLRIRVKNSLKPYDSRGWDGDHNVPHALDTTNLHLHGMDIAPHLFAPLGTSDPLAEMIAIRPGQTFEYPFQLPDDQPPGLYWYHPHHHGSTAVQAVSGMAGVLIVYGAIDEVPEIKAARDIVLAMQDIGLFPSETEADLWTYEPKQNAIWQTFGGNVTIYNKQTGQNDPTNLKGGFTTGDYALRFYLLNGEPFFKEVHNQSNAAYCPAGSGFAPQQCPAPTQLPVQRIKMQPGEVVRFRMLNACSDNLMPIVVDGHDMYLIALDGVNFPAPRQIPQPPAGSTSGQVLLAPANRAEFLIKAGTTPGVYKVRQLAQNQQFLASVEKVICEIEIAGTSKDMALPTALPLPRRNYPLIKPEEVQRIREIQFVGNFPGVINKVVGIDFLINNTIYQETAVPTVVDLEGIEEWRIIVGDKHHGGTEGHPFHLHVVSMEVILTGGILDPDNGTISGGVVPPPGTFQDVLWIQAGTVSVVRMRFKQWIGKSVYHCHILPHEDTGMMQNFLIVDPKMKRHHG